MVAVQMFLCAYFSLAKTHGRVGDVKFISAQRKLAMACAPEEGPESAGPVPTKAGSTAGSKAGSKEKYAENKKYAISATRHYLEHVIEDFGNLVLLDMYRKKDDLCDSFLQAVAFVEGRGACSRTSYKRRPTRPRGTRGTTGTNGTKGPTGTTGTTGTGTKGTTGPSAKSKKRR
jgi:hypothetical protein